MKIIIVGQGKVGLLLAERLSAEGHDVTVVDSDPTVIAETQETVDILTVEGNGAALDTLMDAGAGQSDLLIATTDADETNLLCCLTAKKLGCKRTIARVRNPQYVKQAIFLKEELGLSFAVNPELAAAKEIFRLIQFPTFLKRETFVRGKVELVELQITKDSKLKGKHIYETASLLGPRVLICAVERNDKVTIPNGRFVLQTGDRITVTAAATELVSLIRKLGLEKTKIKSAMIVGCSRVAEYLAEDLIKSGVSVKLLDKKREVCERFSLRFPEALVLHADAARHGVLEAEGIEHTDAVITLTGMDEENLIISMFASHKGVSKTVTKIDRQEYARLFSDQGIGSVVCPKDLTANEIVRYVRAVKESGEGAAVKALHRIVDGKAEALEFEVRVAAEYTNIPLRRLSLKPNNLLACISRNNQIIIPKGDDMLMVGDNVIVVTTTDQAVGELRDIFLKDVVEA
ncbi:MAG: Trk system potassium transporter TrkA [Clostridia bacterium]|nr:Trk system potassium transporter TrkA [Clostridia bacterium]